MNAAARVVSDTQKYHRGLTNLLHYELHWLDVPKAGALQALCNCSPMSAAQGITVYIMDCCINTSETLLVGRTCGPLAAVSCSCLDTGVRCSVVAPFLWLA